MESKYAFYVYVHGTFSYRKGWVVLIRVKISRVKQSKVQVRVKCFNLKFMHILTPQLFYWQENVPHKASAKKSDPQLFTNPGLKMRYSPICACTQRSSPIRNSKHFTGFCDLEKPHKAVLILCFVFKQMIRYCISIAKPTLRTTARETNKYLKVANNVITKLAIY